MTTDKKIENRVQCCYCKNNGLLSEDFHNVFESSNTETETKVIRNHIAHGCYVCKQIADRRQ